MSAARPTILSWAIRTRREMAGLSQQELSKRSGVERSYISALEAGRKRNLSWESLEKLARGLEVSVADLFGLASAYQGEQRTDGRTQVLLAVDEEKAPVLKALEVHDACALSRLEAAARRLAGL